MHRNAAIGLTWLLLWTPAMAEEIAYPALTARLRDCGEAMAAPEFCRLRRDPDAATAEALLAGQRTAARREGDALTLVTRNAAPAVEMNGALNAPMARIPGTDLWTLTIRSPLLDDAVLDVFVLPPVGGRVEPFDWLGPKARLPESVVPFGRPLAPLAGRIVQTSVKSAALAAERSLTVYLPPGHDPARRYPVIYMADGQGVGGYAYVLEPGIVAGRIAPVVIVGLHNGDNEQRSRDYLVELKGSSEGFAAHQAFLLNEVMPRAEREWGASADPSQRLLIGKSSGGAWAVDTALRNPGLFRQAAGFAVVWNRAGEGIERSDRPRLYLVTGVFDFGVVNARDLARRAKASSAETVAVEPVSGHGDLFYQAELERVVAWAFGPA